jgi:hypothetical protein
MSSHVPTHPVAEEEPQQKGMLGKLKETFGLGGGAQEGTSTTERVKETAHGVKEELKEKVAPGTPGRAGPVCAPSEVGAARRRGAAKAGSKAGRGRVQRRASAACRLWKRRVLGVAPSALSFCHQSA